MSCVLARLCPPVASLIGIARPRLERQTHYAAVFARGGTRAAAIAEALDHATDCISGLARPTAVRIPLTAEPGVGSVRIEGTVTLHDPAIVAALAGGGTLSAAIVTLGYGQDAAFARLDRDYMLHHVQTDLARETLFAFARAADREERARLPGLRLKRIPVQAHGLCGQRQLWDPAQVQALLSAFGPANPGVSQTDSGFFDPLHSLLSLTLVCSA